MIDAASSEVDGELLGCDVRVSDSWSCVQAVCESLLYEGSLSEVEVEVLQLDAAPLDCEGCRPALLVPERGREGEEVAYEADEEFENVEEGRDWLLDATVPVTAAGL
jgi:hypothetical protein